MSILIVESSAELGRLWQRHIERSGARVTLVSGQEDAIAHLQREEVQVIVLNLLLSQGSAFAVADFASYRWPKARVVFVTGTSFFSDGSIFRHIPNACAYVPDRTRPEDIAAIVEHYAEA